MRAFILAAGLGTRLRPLTDHTPKALIKINGKPLLQHAIEYLYSFGIQEFIVNIHYLGEQIESFVRDFQPTFGGTIYISDERNRLLDTGGGLKKAINFFDDAQPILIYNADILTTLNILDFINFYQIHKPLVALAVRHRNSSRSFLIDSFSQTLKGWYNRNTGEVKSGLAILEMSNYEQASFSGIHIINPQAFGYMPQEDIFSIVDWYLDLARAHELRVFWHDDDAWFDVGKPNDLEKAARFFSENSETDAGHT